MYQLIEQYVNVHPFIYGCGFGLAAGCFIGFVLGNAWTWSGIDKVREQALNALSRDH